MAPQPANPLITAQTAFPASEEDLDAAYEDETTPSSPESPHLREISSLASWTVSTYKPGCGIAALLSPSPLQFWQSDGPQPHLLTIHFFKLVKIVRLSIYLDFELDESYTPTKMAFAAGTGEYDLVEFADWKGAGPRGWQEISLDNCEPEMGGDGGGVLRCMCLQVRVLENHQNGKDTHIRGVQIYAKDERVRGKEKEKGKEKERRRVLTRDEWEEKEMRKGKEGLTLLDWEEKMGRMQIEEFMEELEVR